MSAAKPCTCTARCGDCPGIRSGETKACEAYLEAEAGARLHAVAPDLLALLRRVRAAGFPSPGLEADFDNIERRLGAN